MLVDAKELAMRSKNPKSKGGKGKALFHGRMRGLNNDDHLQYLTTQRGDKRYYTIQTVKNIIEKLPKKFHTKEVIDDLLTALEESLMAVLFDAYKKDLIVMADEIINEEKKEEK